jgi:hypothetical protein
MTAITSPASSRTTRPVPPSGRAAAPRPARAAFRTWVLLGGLVALVVAAGLWGLSGSRGGEAPVGLGDEVRFAGGAFVAESVAEIDLSHPMAGPGMQMPMGAGVPEIAEGVRRVEVDVTVIADTSGDLRFETEQFRIRGAGMAPAGPVTPEQGGAFVPAGGSLTRTLTFEVPEELTELTLTRVDGERGVTLPLVPATGDDHDHS